MCYINTIAMQLYFIVIDKEIRGRKVKILFTDLVNDNQE